MIKQFKNKKKKGFTLVELIAVIAIIGILAAVIVPMVGKYTIKAKESKASEQMREFVMALETASAEVGVAMPANTITPATALITAEPAKTANDMIIFLELNMIQDISIANCKLVLGGTHKPTMTGDVATGVEVK